MAVVKILTVGLCFLVTFTIAKVIPLSDTDEVTVTSQISDDPNDIQFFLYPNAANPSDEDELIFDNPTSIANSRYDPNKRLILYSSGFYQNRTSDQLIKDTYLSHNFAPEANIVVIDWGKLSGNTVFSPDVGLSIAQHYIDASSNVAVVGKRVQEFLSFLIREQFLSGPEAVHCVGMSLGAHVCGRTGHHVKQAIGRPLKRVTGLDGASPLFKGFTTIKRLDANDAEFVVILHVDDGKIGYSGNYGTVDFYVNGGKGPQPGCEESEQVFCSHYTATKYYAKSIADRSLLAFDCKCCLKEAKPSMPFGEYCPPSAVGAYYIDLLP